MTSPSALRWERYQEGAPSIELQEVLSALESHCSSWLIQLYQLEAILHESAGDGEVRELVSTGESVETPVEMTFDKLLDLARKSTVNGVRLVATPLPRGAREREHAGCTPTVKLTLHDGWMWMLETSDIEVASGMLRRFRGATMC